MATYTDKFSSGGATLKLTVTREDYSTANNTSYLKCVLQITKNGDYASFNLGGASISMTIAEKKLYSSDTFDIRSLSIGSTKTLATKYITVTHNSDGTKSVPCKASFSSGVALGSASISKTYTCGTIPRASSLSLSASSVNVGSSITANITRKSTSFTHTVEFYIDSSYYKKYTGVSTSRSFTIPTSWYNAMPTSTSCTAYCRITTKNSSGTQVGDRVKKSFTIKVPTSIKPTISSDNIDLNPTNVTINGTSYNYLIQNINKLTITASDCKAGSGSSIKSYTFSGPSVSKTTTSASTSVSSVSTSGSSLTYKVTVTDKRGRTNSATQTIKCYEYSKPTISLSLNRNGNTLQCTYKTIFSSVNGKNSAKVIIYVDGSLKKTITGVANGSSATEPITLDSADATYKVYAKVVDALGGTTQTVTKTVFGGERIMNVLPSGKGIAFGKKSEKTGFECAWASRFYKNAYMEGHTYLDKNTSYIYGRTTDNEAAAILRMSTNNNVLLGSQSVANATYIYGGKDDTVNIGSSDYKSNLYVTGKISNASGILHSSDKRVKKNIENLDVDIIDRLQSVRYELIGFDDGKTHYGFVAQDVIQALSEAGIDPEATGIVDTIPNGEYEQYALAYTEFIPLLVTKCQSLQSEVNRLHQEIAEIKQLIT